MPLKNTKTAEGKWVLIIIVLTPFDDVEYLKQVFKLIES